MCFGQFLSNPKPPPDRLWVPSNRIFKSAGFVRPKMKLPEPVFDHAPLSGALQRDKLALPGFSHQSLANAAVQRLNLTSNTGSADPSPLLSKVSDTASVESKDHFFQELTFTEPLSFSNFLQSVYRLAFRSQHIKDTHPCALCVMVQRKVCTNNRRAVAC